MNSRAHAEWAGTAAWGMFLAALLTGCWIEENGETERERLRLEFAKEKYEGSK